jgi:Nuclease-related domain
MARPQISPDGRWWWDGGGWHQVSTDGRWWWDGTQWLELAPQVLPNSVRPVLSEDGEFVWDGQRWLPTNRVRAPSLLLKHVRIGNGEACLLCGSKLTAGSKALYHYETRTFRCIQCPDLAALTSQKTLQAGVAGASAQRQYQRRMASIAGGNLDLRNMTIESQRIRAWAVGATGEQAVAHLLSGVAGIRVLHDRRVRGRAANVDHIVVSPAGVFVIDTKYFAGLVRIVTRTLHGRTDYGLLVGGRDRSHAVENVACVCIDVQRVLESVGHELDYVPIEPVLCFIDADRLSFRTPTAFRGVTLVGTNSVKRLITRSQLLSAGEIERVSRILSIAFPPR